MTDYVEAWPNYCRSCSGWGVTTYRQSVPYGSTSASFDVADPCAACTNLGKCARCGLDGLSSEERGDGDTGTGPCEFCGWDYDEGSALDAYEPEE